MTGTFVVQTGKSGHEEFAALHRPISHNKVWFRHALSLLSRHDIRSAEVLDLCCGSGEFAELLTNKFDCRVVCGDIAQTNLARTAALGFETTYLDLDSPTLMEDVAPRFVARFGLVTFLEAVEHVFDTDAVLQLIHAALEPGGIAVISTPNMGFVGYRLYSLINGGIPFRDGHHIRFFDQRRLTTFLFLNGFEVIDSDNYLWRDEDLVSRMLGDANSRVLRFVVNLLYGSSRRLRGLSSRWFDSGLVLLARKEDVPPTGLEMRYVRPAVESAGSRRTEVVARLKLARARGMLREHTWLRAYVDTL